MALRTLVKTFYTSALLPVPQWSFTRVTSLPGQLVEKFLRLPLWGALLTAAAIWAVQQSGLLVTFSSWTTLSTLIIPLMPCVFAVVVPLVANPMYSLLHLLGVFFSTVLFYLVNGAEYLGLTLMIVYVGAVAVIFLFVLMLLNAKDHAEIKDLLIHVTQHLAVFSMLALFSRMWAQVYTPIEAVVAVCEASFMVLEPTSAEAVEFFVRYQFNDIARILPLYTQHGVLFLVLTTVLLASLLGAIILATQTTERPVSAQTAYVLAPEKASAGFIVGLLVDSEELFAKMVVHTPMTSEIALTHTLLAGAATLLAFIFVYRGHYPKLPGRANKKITTPTRYWRWRSPRAASLSRTKYGVADNRLNLIRPFGSNVRDFTRSANTNRWILQKYGVPVGWSRVRRLKKWRLPVRLSSPVRLRRSGPFWYSKYIWYTGLLPRIVFYAWRINFFIFTFLRLLFITPVILIVGLSLVGYYTAAWDYLCTVPTFLEVDLVRELPFYSHTAPAVRWLIGVFLYFPAVIFYFLINNWLSCTILAGFMTADVIDLYSKRYTSYLTRSENRRVFKKGVREHINGPDEEVILTKEELEYSKRHPDKGRTDCGWGIALTLPLEPEGASEAFGAVFKEWFTPTKIEVPKAPSGRANDVYMYDQMWTSLTEGGDWFELFIFLAILLWIYTATTWLLCTFSERPEEDGDEGATYPTTYDFLLQLAGACAVTWYAYYQMATTRLNKDIMIFREWVYTYKQAVVTWWPTGNFMDVVPYTKIIFPLVILSFLLYWWIRVRAKRRERSYNTLYARRYIANKEIRVGLATYSEKPRSTPRRLIRRFKRRRVRLPHRRINFAGRIRSARLRF